MVRVLLGPPLATAIKPAGFSQYFEQDTAKTMAESGLFILRALLSFIDLTVDKFYRPFPQTVLVLNEII